MNIFERIWGNKYAKEFVLFMATAVAMVLVALPAIVLGAVAGAVVLVYVLLFGDPTRERHAPARLPRTPARSYIAMSARTDMLRCWRAAEFLAAARYEAWCRACDPERRDVLFAGYQSALDNEARAAERYRSVCT